MGGSAMPLATREAIDSMYEERNALVLCLAALAHEAGWKVGVKFHIDDPGWPTIFIETPYGQVSWHIPSREVPTSLPDYDGEWDEHTTQDKYLRLARLARSAWPEK